MADRRTKRQKLEAMANQSVSPKEAEIAKEKLKDLAPDQPQAEWHVEVNINGVGFDFPRPDPDAWLDGVWVYNPVTGRFENVTRKQ